LAAKGKWIYTTCHMCGGTSGIKCTWSTEGRQNRAQRVQPYRGGEYLDDYAKKRRWAEGSGKGQCRNEALYDPDRLKTPMKRVGPRGSVSGNHFLGRSLDDVSKNLLSVGRNTDPKRCFGARRTPRSLTCSRISNCLRFSELLDAFNTCDVARKPPLSW